MKKILTFLFVALTLAAFLFTPNPVHAADPARSALPEAAATLQAGSSLPEVATTLQAGSADAGGR